MATGLLGSMVLATGVVTRRRNVGRKWEIVTDVFFINMHECVRVTVSVLLFSI